MLKKHLKLKIFLCVLAFSAGIIFLMCGAVGTIPKGVIIDGVGVGGMTRPAAIAMLRENTVNDLKKRELKIISDGGTYTFCYPEINFSDNFKSLVYTAKKGQILSSHISYYLCGINEIAAGICLDESISVVEPEAKFSAFGEPFSYDGGRDGREVDLSRLTADIKNSLCGDFSPVEVKYIPKTRTKTLDDVRKKTQLISRFTTYFDGRNIARGSNIRLAAAKLNGAEIGAGEILSFNLRVGERKKERGFLPAKIIENGEYVDGVGGGVCQVSTTLYNAALLCGLKIEEYHPHSLAVGYVPPSRDAMVSGESCDLKIKNTRDCPVYVRASAGENSVTVALYGEPDGASYSLESSILESIPAPEEICDDPAKVREGKDGLKSECYIISERDGFISRTRLRRDSYKATSGFRLAENLPPQN